MFRRRKYHEVAGEAGQDDEPGAQDKIFGLKPSTGERADMATLDTPTPLRPEIPRRVADIPGVPRAATLGAMETEDAKKLIVGREIRLSGEITACDKLVVEGRVEANLSDSHAIEIAPTGYFKGDAEVDEAVISGEFSGTLRVRGRLVVRATGRIAGEVRYGELEVEAGGKIVGQIDEFGTEPAAAAAQSASADGD